MNAIRIALLTIAACTIAIPAVVHARQGTISVPSPQGYYGLSCKVERLVQKTVCNYRNECHTVYLRGYTTVCTKRVVSL